MILRKYFTFGITFLTIITVQSENITKQATAEKVNKNIVKENHIKKCGNITEQPLVEMDENRNQSSERVMKVVELNLNDEDKVMLQNLNDIIEKRPEEELQSMIKREGKLLKDENFKKAAEALTDEEITEIIKSISFPNKDEISEDSEVIKLVSESRIEPRTSNGRSLRNHGYYVIAFTPIDEETDNKLHKTVPYARLQILPAERSVDDDAYENPRHISKKAWNKYIRHIMRQIRKGTRKIQRKTKLKTLKEEPTVENFLKRMYKITQENRLKQQQTKNKSFWFIW